MESQLLVIFTDKSPRCSSLSLGVPFFRLADDAGLSRPEEGSQGEDDQRCRSCAFHQADSNFSILNHSSSCPKCFLLSATSL